MLFTCKNRIMRQKMSKFNITRPGAMHHNYPRIQMHPFEL